MNHELSKLNLIKEKDTNDNNFTLDQTNNVAIFNAFKSDFTKKNNSIFTNLFFFISENKTICQFCKTIKYNYQALYLLEFPLEVVYNYCLSKNINPIDNKGEICLNLNQCFEQYRNPSYFTGENAFYCNICQGQRDSYYFNNIFSLPPVLIIILNRGKGKSFKCNVDFPDNLFLQQFIICPDSISSYELKGVITHLGESGMSGHFIAYCKHRLDNNWYCYNDSIVTYCNDQKNGFRIGTPYILFYENNDRKQNILFENYYNIKDDNIYNRNIINFLKI
jgi:ubiquitin C-terminal hydrolase